MNEIDFKGQTVLVTGGSSGIGNGIARTFRDHGAAVHITGTRESASDYRSEYGSEMTGLTYHQLDVSDDKAVQEFDPAFDRLDVLVNSVGAVQYKRREFQIDVFRNVLDVNLIGVMACCVKFHDLLADSKGSIIIIGSTGSFHAVPFQPAYSASKGALVTLIKSLAVAWARDGIRVNGIAPGPVKTKMTKISHQNPEIDRRTQESVPLGRWGAPEEMGGPALFLASPLASYITGLMIPVDGGLTTNV